MVLLFVIQCICCDHQRRETELSSTFPWWKWNMKFRLMWWCHKKTSKRICLSLLIYFLLVMKCELIHRRFDKRFEWQTRTKAAKGEHEQNNWIVIRFIRSISFVEHFVACRSSIKHRSQLICLSFCVHSLAHALIQSSSINVQQLLALLLLFIWPFNSRVLFANDWTTKFVARSLRIRYMSLNLWDSFQRFMRILVDCLFPHIHALSFRFAVLPLCVIIGQLTFICRSIQNKKRRSRKKK